MRTVDCIQKKRDGLALAPEEIRHLVRGFVNGSIPDYQMAAWAMAVFFRGMTPEETACLTMEMADSGDRIDLSAIRGIKVDKHSTGGVGDTTTLVLGPLVAAAGVPVAKMSGRGLGHTGGTIDKLESIPGFRTELAPDEFASQVNRIGIALTGQTGNITPADKKLYALRDVTATVNSLPLIASSIMSKKIAAGADAIVLDVKTGRGAFMKSLEESVLLAERMVDIGRRVGRTTVAVISDMNQPLGYAVGNALEVSEAIGVLAGEGPADLRELCLELGSHMVVLGGRAASAEEARRLLERLLDDGSALLKFHEFLAAQGARVPGEADRLLGRMNGSANGGVPAPLGKEAALRLAGLWRRQLPAATFTREIAALRDGFVTDIDAEAVGSAAMLLGAGRETKEAAIDHAAGVVLRRKVGDRVEAGEPLAELHWSGGLAEGRTEQASRLLLEAYRIGDGKEAPPPLIRAVVTEDGVRMRNAVL